MAREAHVLRRTLVLVTAAALIAAACNRGGEEPQDDGTDGVDAQLQAFCSAIVDAEARFVAEGPEADVEQLLVQVEENAPEELREDVAIVAAAVRAAAEDPSQFERPEFGEANEAIDRYVVESCGYETVEVSGVEYAFEGVPDTIQSGRVGFLFSNDGEELHEMVVFRINEGVDQPFEEILQLPQEEGQELVTFVDAGFGPPGESDAEVMELEPGRYGIACFVPMGSTDPDAPADGPPHFTEGMLAELTVE